MKFKILILSAIATVSLSAMEQKKSYNTYQGNVIDATTLYKLSDKMPTEVACVVNDWSEKNKGLLQLIAPLANKRPVTREPIEKLRAEILQALAEAKLKTKIKHNYIFKFPQKIDDKEFWNQLPGEGLVRMNIAKHNKFDWSEGPTHHRNLTEQHEKVDTFQGVSRVANYLRAKEKIEQIKAANNGICYFKVPNTYLVQIPGRDAISQSVKDENSFVLQESVGKLPKLRKKIMIDGKEQIEISINIAKITPEQLKHTLDVVAYAGLFDTDANLLYDPANGVVVMTDLEQPLDECPADFYNKSTAKFWSNVGVGFDKIVFLLEKATEKGLDVKELRKTMIEYIKNDSEIQTCSEVGKINSLITRLEKC